MGKESLAINHRNHKFTSHIILKRILILIHITNMIPPDFINKGEERCKDQYCECLNSRARRVGVLVDGRGRELYLATC